MTPEETLSAFLDSFNNLRTDEFLDFFAPDATIFFPTPGQPTRLDGEMARTSWVAIHDQFRAALPGPPYLSFASRDLVTQRFGDTVVATFHLDGPDGRLNRRTVVMELQDGQWKIVHLHASVAP